MADPTIRRQQLLDEVGRLGLGAPAKMDLSMMVAAMLDPEFDNDEGRDTYSTLSAVAMDVDKG